MTLLAMILFFASLFTWIFIGEVIIGHLINAKGYSISSFWKWNYLWPLELFELLDKNKNPKRNVISNEKENTYE